MLYVIFGKKYRIPKKRWFSKDSEKNGFDASSLLSQKNEHFNSFRLYIREIDSRLCDTFHLGCCLYCFVLNMHLKRYAYFKDINLLVSLRKILFKTDYK